MASGDSQNVGQNPTSSIYHSTDEINPEDIHNSRRRHSLPGGRREKQPNVNHRQRRSLRRRSNNMSSADNGDGIEADQAVGEPLVGRILRFFSSRSSTSFPLSRNDSHNDRGPIVLREEDAEGREEADQGRNEVEIQLRPNPLYEPVLREEEGSEEVPVELHSDYEMSQEEDSGRTTSCCLPCRRKSLRHRRTRRAPHHGSHRLGNPDDPWWYQNVGNRPVNVKEGLEAPEADWAIRQPTPPPLPPLPHGMRSPDLPNCFGPLVPIGGNDPIPGTAGSTTASVHSQIDYQHYFIPDLAAIYACPYYWGVMDRYEAGEVLANKPSGSFLLRDSAQSNFIFSISFRGRGRTLHARIDVFRHSFSFDCCDPQVAKSPTVMGLLAKYQRREVTDDQLEAGAAARGAQGAPEVVHPISMYEPTLKQPVFRRQTFTLQDISRAVICTHFTYDQVQQMSIPWNLKNYMNIYHYKHQVGARHVSSEG